MADKEVSTNNTPQKAERPLSPARQKKLRKDNVKSSSALIGSIFGFIFVLAALSVLYQTFVNSNVPTFSLEYFIEFMGNAPSIDLSWMSRVSQGISSISIGPLSTFINLLWMPVSLLLWIIQGIAQIYIYVGYFLYYFFGFSSFKW